MMATDDDATNQQLKLLVGLVVVLGAVCVLGSIVLIGRSSSYPLLSSVLLTALIAVVNIGGVHLRVRAANLQFSAVSTAVLVTAVIEPIGWAILSAAAGLLISKLVLVLSPTKVPGLSPTKIAYNVAKEAAAAAATAGTFLLFDAPPLGPSPSSSTIAHHLMIMPLAALAYAVVDDALFFPVIAVATGTSIRKRFIEHLDIRLVSRLAGLALAGAATIVVTVDRWLLVALPALLYAMHIASTARVRSREERAAWQRLARTTDELNAVDLDGVLRTAVMQAAELFSADEVEIELSRDSADARLVRGDGDGIQYNGPAANAPRLRGGVIPTALESHDGHTEIGVLRLRFHGEVKLTEREQYTLRTFAAALCTAIRNASAFAETQRLAADHARAASQDPLTKLANRRRLEEYATEVLGRPARGVTALMLLDLNRFKEVNDTLGHSAGDRVLIEIGNRLEATATPGDLVARFGGDEFAILFTELPAPPVAMPRAQTALASIAAPMELDGMRISVEATAGIAIADGSADITELLRRADVAMYQAKKNGQQVTRYAAARDTADIGSLALVGDLARAIAEEEFFVKFQPIVDLGTAEIIGAEALARWDHPDHGELAPGKFLDAIERSTLLAAFAQTILDQALTAAGKWRDAGYMIPVAVNVSPRSLLDPRFPDTIKESLRRHDLPTDALVIELTESLTLSQLEVVDEVLGALRDAGVVLALDDFGTGYSSLSTLARVPVQELKIDRSFVAEMNSPAAAAVVRSTIELGRSLELLVVAEGVESEDQRRRLWELGCAAAQGYLFARAMPLDTLLATLNRGFAGRPRTLAEPLHEAGSVVRIPRRTRTNQRLDRSS
jgi:diguanylate cyclase (GGDEF)-like protein